MLTAFLNLWRRTPVTMTDTTASPVERLQTTLHALSNASAAAEEAIAQLQDLEGRSLDNDTPEAVEARLRELQQASDRVAEHQRTAEELRRTAQSLDVAVFQQRRAQRARDLALAVRGRDEASAAYEKLVTRRQAMQEAIDKLATEIDQAQMQMAEATSQMLALEPKAERKVTLSRTSTFNRDVPRGLMRVVEWQRAIDVLMASNAHAVELTVDERTGRIVAADPSLPGLVSGGAR